MADNFRIEDLYQATLQHWWILFLGVVLGGLAGLTATYFTDPLYEASASILISIDFNRASIRDDFTIYQANDRVRELLLSDETLQGSIDRLGVDSTNDLFNSPAEFRDHLRIAQHPASFELFFYAHEPKLAAEGANAWAQAGIASIEQAYLYAVRAVEYQSALYEANCTLELRTVGTEERPIWVCNSDDLGINAEDLPDLLLDEVMGSRGILPIYSFALGQEATAPQKPILWSRTEFILAGIGLGTVLGFLASYFIQSVRTRKIIV
jgi:uncharacterized protein involved in exopolysaccharide biosynthesis